MPRESPSALAPLSPALRERIERAYQSRGSRVREIAELCRSQFPHYRALSGEGLASLYSNVDRVVGAFYRLQLVEGRMPTSEELEPQRRAARQRVAQGVPLPEMVGCYQSGLALLWADLVASLDADAGVQGELLQRVPVTIAANTLVTTAATEAYVEERERRMRSRDEAVDELLRLFAAGEAPLAVLEARAHALGLGLDAPRTAVLFRPAPGSGDGANSAVDAVRGLLADRQLGAELVIGRVPAGVLALLPEGADGGALADVAGKLRGHGWRTGVGGPGGDAAGLRRSIREAARAVEIGELLALEGAVDRYADLAVLDLVDVGSPRAADFARSVLGPLADPARSGKALETLRAMCRNGFRLKLAAAALGLHPHTLSYRLEQLRRRHGLDLDDAETRLRVHLAVLILGR
jgi:sugar diacid utilization regulator